MKKIKLADSIRFDRVRRMLKNAASDDSATAFIDAVRELLDEIEAAEVEYDEAAIKEELTKLLEGKIAENEEEVMNKVTEMMAKRFASLQNSVKPTLPAKVKNEVCAAYLRSNKGSEREAVEAVLVKNAISGLSFADVIDYSIIDGWGKSDALFSQFTMTRISKWFYTTQDFSDDDILAKQWAKTSETDKLVQELTVNGKTLACKYIYKIMDVPFEDIDAAETTGDAANLLNWINEELDRQIVNSIVMAILVGDSVNADGSQITCFESIGTKTSTDAFTSVLTYDSSKALIDQLRALADAVKNPNGVKSVMIMNKATRTAAARFVYATGGTPTYITDDVLAGIVGVDEIIISDRMSNLTADDKPAAIAMLPSEYWVREIKAQNFAYPVYLRNKMNYQKERNIAGGIHGLKSTAVLRSVEAAG